MNWETEKHPLSIQGKYYVDIKNCLDHEFCIHEAPNNFKMDEDTWSAYVFKQPENVEEKLKCQEAMKCCPVEAIRDDSDM